MADQSGVYECYVKCEDALVRLLGAFHRDDSLRRDVTEEFEKYRVWASNTGACNGGDHWELSLDYRLQEASFLKSQVVRLLESLCKTADKTTSLLIGTRKPFEEIGVQSLTESESDDGASSDSPWDISDDSSTEGDGHVVKGRVSANQHSVAAFIPVAHAPTEMAQLLGSLKYTIVCLYKIPLRRPAPIDRVKAYAGRDMSLYQHFDVLYLRDKFPAADDRLVRRLGKLISQRRQLLEYRVAHNERLRRKPEFQARTHPSLEAKPSNATELAPSTIESRPDKGKSIQETASSVGKMTKHTKATLLQLDQPIESMESLYPPSIAESILSAVSEFTENQKLHIPPRPVGENGQPLSTFECPYCGIVKHIPVEKTRAWEKHVLQDLQPYVCTFEGCDMFDHMFSSREDWFNHELQVHRAMWSCNTCVSAGGVQDSKLSFHTETEFSHHMGQVHNMDQETLLRTLEAFRRPVPVTRGSCSFCGRDASKLKSHLGRHLEQMALFALPRPAPSGISGSRNVQAKSAQERSEGGELSRGTLSSDSSAVSFTDERKASDSSEGPESGRAKQPAHSPAGSDDRHTKLQKSVTRLLIATKQLLETLTQWSRSQATDTDVSDVYVRLGVEFNMTCRAFSVLNVGTSDLGNFPDELRNILEPMLSQEASPQSLEKYLPRVREIIISLLEALKRKQTALRQKRPETGSGRSEKDAKQEQGVEDGIVVPEDDTYATNNQGQDVSWDDIKPEFAEARQAMEHGESIGDSRNVKPSEAEAGSNTQVSLPLVSDARQRLAEEWPLHRVLEWLQTNSFSEEWQLTFKELDLHGSVFLNLGHRSGFRVMHERIHPNLAQVYMRTGTGRDQERENEEGRRLRRLVREMAKSDAQVDGVAPPRQSARVLGNFDAGVEGKSARTTIQVDPSSETEPDAGKSAATYTIALLGWQDWVKAAVAYQLRLAVPDHLETNSISIPVLVDDGRCLMKVVDTTGMKMLDIDATIRGSDGFVIVYDATEYGLDQVREIHSDILVIGGHSPTLLLGITANISNERARIIPSATGDALATELGCMFAESSLKSSSYPTIPALFQSIVWELYRKPGQKREDTTQGRLRGDKKMTARPRFEFPPSVIDWHAGGSGVTDSADTASTRVNPPEPTFRPVTRLGDDLPVPGTPDSRLDKLADNVRGTMRKIFRRQG